MPIQIEGIYEDGKVTLRSTPAGLRRSKVVVTFVEEPVADASQAQQGKTFGSLYGAFPGSFVTNDEDFEAAEWHPKSEDLDV